MPLMEPVPWEHLDEELQQLIEEGRSTRMLSTPLPSQIFAYAPDVAKDHIRRYRTLFQGRLDGRLRELVRLRVASYNDCQPCQVARKSDDVSEEDLACLGSDDDRFTPREQAALRFADLFVTDHFSIDARMYRELGEHFSKAEIVELGMSVASALGIGRFVHTLDVLDDEVEPVLPYDGEFAPSPVSG